MKNKDREIVFNKYGGRCAYCGCELVKGWHVDEIEPVRRTEQYKRDERGKVIYIDHKPVIERLVMHPERFHIDNQNPACASCNINKHSGSLESFRELIQGFINSLNRDSTQYKIAKRYGLISENIKPIQFYFETVQETKNKKSMENVPKKIYLQIDADGETPKDFKELVGVSWCSDRINKNDIEYNLLPSEAEERIKELEEALHEAKTDLNGFLKRAHNNALDKVYETAQKFFTGQHLTKIREELEKLKS